MSEQKVTSTHVLYTISVLSFVGLIGKKICRVLIFVAMAAW